MKLIFSFGLLVLVAVGVLATSFPPSTTVDTVNVTVSTGYVTNLTGNSVFIESPLYHTFQAVNSGTNSVSVAIDRSLDGSNWIGVTTNVLAASGTAETTMTGKWSYFRVRYTGTNSPVTVTYLGGR